MNKSIGSRFESESKLHGKPNSLRRNRTPLLNAEQGSLRLLPSNRFMGRYTVSGSGARCKRVVNDSGGSTPSLPTIKTRYSNFNYIGYHFYLSHKNQSGSNPSKEPASCNLRIQCNGSTIGSNPISKSSNLLIRAIWRGGVMVSQRTANPSYL